MFHCAAWGQQLDPGGILTAITAAQEGAFFTDGSRFKVDPRLSHLVGAGALINDVTAERALLMAPSLRDEGGVNIEPVAPAGAFGSAPEVTTFGASPVLLEPGELVEAFVLSTPGVARRHMVLAWLSDGLIIPIKEAIHNVRASAAVPQRNFAWVNAPITFEQTLPSGRYIVVGMRCRASSGVAARLVFRDQLGRPGGPMVENVDDLDGEQFRFGNMGVWGSFLQEDPPTLDVYHGTAVAQTLVLDLIRF